MKESLEKECQGHRKQGCERTEGSILCAYLQLMFTDCQRRGLDILHFNLLIGDTDRARKDTSLLPWL